MLLCCCTHDHRAAVALLRQREFDLWTLYPAADLMRVAQTQQATADDEEALRILKGASK